MSTKLVKQVLSKTSSLISKPSPISKFMTMLLTKKLYYDTYKKTENPNKIYWISPEKINHTAIFQNETERLIHSKEKIRGGILDGNWDKDGISFTDLEIFRNIRQTIEKDEELHNADFFKRILTKAKSPNDFWGKANTEDFQKLFEYLYSKRLISNYNTGNQTRHLHSGRDYDDTIDVNIGRNGEYLFQKNAYLLSVAKVLRVKTVPVRVFIRHKKWHKFKEFVINYLQNDIEKGLLYQPIIHPDFVSFPVQSNNKCQETMEAIKASLNRKGGLMLDIGANIGFFCHKFEDLGYKCYAVENDPNNFRILEALRDAEDKKFFVFNNSIFELGFIRSMRFDVVLALNIFHHFLKTRELFNHLTRFLHDLDTNFMFLSTAHYREDQMRDAYQNYSEPRFVKFILKNTSLNKSEPIFTGRYSRQLYKLSK